MIKKENTTSFISQNVNMGNFYVAIKITKNKTKKIKSISILSILEARHVMT